MDVKQKKAIFDGSITYLFIEKRFFVFIMTCVELKSD